jgi:hypothetical protein
MADRKGPVIFGLPATDAASAAMALSRMGSITQVHKDIALEMAIRGVVHDAWRTPPPAGPSGPVLPPGTGWREPPPLEVPGGATSQRYIDAFAHAFQPHQPGNPEYVGPKAAPAAPAPAPAAAAPAEPVGGPGETQGADPKPAAASVVRRRLT